MIKYLKNLLSPIMAVLVLATPQMIQAMEDQEAVENITQLPLEIQEYILETAIKDNCYELNFAGNLALVCTTWNKFVNEERYTSPLFKNLKVNLQTKCLYDIFYNGELIYRPAPHSDEGMICLKISDLANPSEGTFNLSKCGDAANYLSISTGYRKGKIAENANKVEIWFAPREFIKQELKAGRAQQFAGIFPNWKPTAQVGIFWTWGDDDEDKLNMFDYLVTSDNLTLSSKNLYENWRDGRRARWHPVRGGRGGRFHVHFK